MTSCISGTKYMRYLHHVLHMACRFSHPLVHFKNILLENVTCSKYFFKKTHSYSSKKVCQFAHKYLAADCYTHSKFHFFFRAPRTKNERLYFVFRRGSHALHSSLGNVYIPVVQTQVCVCTTGMYTRPQLLCCDMTQHASTQILTLIFVLCRPQEKNSTIYLQSSPEKLAL